MIKPDLVLHICCAPDEAWVVHTLRDTFSLHCFFSNPNISPAHEYELRLAEAKKVAQKYDVPFTADCYEPQTWEDAIRAYDHTPESGQRCYHCFLLRLRRTARFCREQGLRSFTTVMSISPHKQIAMLNEAGSSAAAEFGIRYEPHDFKKKDGFKNSISLSKELGLYRQNYCGCRLSKAERDERNSRKHIVL